MHQESPAAGPPTSYTHSFSDGAACVAYLLIKSLHIVFVIAWMATVFYLPRILVNIAEAGDEPAVKARLELMGRRLYTFGHSMFGAALIFGLILWLYFHISGGWLHAKLALVAVMLAYFIWSGRALKRSMAGGRLPSSRALRIGNELPVLVLLAIVYLVVAKPF
jgi:putative membrane protein